MQPTNRLFPTAFFTGVEQPADTLFAKTIPYCDIDLKPYQYDPALTEKMLDEAGWQKGSDGIRAKAGAENGTGGFYITATA